MGVRHMCTRVYFIYIYSYYYYNARHQQQLSICFASLVIIFTELCFFRFALLVSSLTHNSQLTTHNSQLTTLNSTLNH